MLSINRSVGQRITYLRTQKGLYQYELAALARIRPKYLGDIETGTKIARISTLALIAAALGVSLRELLGDMEDEM